MLTLKISVSIKWSMMILFIMEDGKIRDFKERALWYGKKVFMKAILMMVKWAELVNSFSLSNLKIDSIFTPERLKTVFPTVKAHILGQTTKNMSGSSKQVKFQETGKWFGTMKVFTTDNGKKTKLKGILFIYKRNGKLTDENLPQFDFDGVWK